MTQFAVSTPSQLHVQKLPVNVVDATACEKAGVHTPVAVRSLLDTVDKVGAEFGAKLGEAKLAIGKFGASVKKQNHVLGYSDQQFIHVTNTFSDADMDPSAIWAQIDSQSPIALLASLGVLRSNADVDQVRELAKTVAYNTAELNTVGNFLGWFNDIQTGKGDTGLLDPTQVRDLLDWAGKHQEVQVDGVSLVSYLRSHGFTEGQPATVPKDVAALLATTFQNKQSAITTLNSQQTLLAQSISADVSTAIQTITNLMNVFKDTSQNVTRNI